MKLAKCVVAACAAMIPRAKHRKAILILAITSRFEKDLKKNLTERGALTLLYGDATMKFLVLNSLRRRARLFSSGKAPPASFHFLQ